MVYRPQDRIWTPANLMLCPISVSDLKSHMRVDSSDEDGVIGAIGFAAVATAEAYTQRLFGPRVCTLSLTNLPSGQEPVELPGGVVVALTSVVVDGVTVTGGTVIGHSPAMLIPAAAWPTVTGVGYPVTITYTAGMSYLPFDLQAAVRLIAADLFENRANSSEVQLREVPISAEYLLRRHRIQAI